MGSERGLGSLLRGLYSFGLAIAFALALPWYVWRGKAGRYLSVFRERMGELPPDLNKGGASSIWIHAVSVGEVLAARPLIAPLRRCFPRHKLFLSTATMTGNGVARRSLADLDGLFYVPFDFPIPVRRALAALRPTLLILVETEIWPNLIHEARLWGARVVLVNGRISPRSFRRYALIRRLMGRILSEVDLFLMQAEPHAERMRHMGAPPDRVRVTGNLKFDALEPPRPAEWLQSLLTPRPDGASHVWVAGSTVAGEEEIILRALREVRRLLPKTALILAPRHPERFSEVHRLVVAAGFGCQLRTLMEPGAWRMGEVVVLDTLGELSQVYGLASVVFVGGSLVPAGGHNILEAAVAGKPVIIGPHMENFQEIADEFGAENAVIQLRGEKDLGREVLGLLQDETRRRELGERAKGLIDRNRGAARGTVDALASLVA